MPCISRFYGIVIKMFFLQREHQPPHFHAIYGEYNGLVDLASLEVIEGDLPNRAERLVKEWAEIHRSELQKMWDTQEFKQIPGLE
ncbi:MAG TPA: hypothetical protein DEB39_09260 [Planctomycetaceae bacterium]|nr:hypothetical protein [Planctomycetaceae bacterium]